MARVMVKVVPDAEPNADGTWMNRRVPAWVLDVDRAKDVRTYQVFSLLTRHCAPEGHHVVQYRHTCRQRERRRLAPALYRAIGALRKGALG